MTPGPGAGGSSNRGCTCTASPRKTSRWACGGCWGRKRPFRLKAASWSPPRRHTVRRVPPPLSGPWLVTRPSCWRTNPQGTSTAGAAARSWTSCGNGYPRRALFTIVE